VLVTVSCMARGAAKDYSGQSSLIIIYNYATKFKVDQLDGELSGLEGDGTTCYLQLCNYLAIVIEPSRHLIVLRIVESTNLTCPSSNCLLIYPCTNLTHPSSNFVLNLPLTLIQTTD